MKGVIGLTKQVCAPHNSGQQASAGTIEGFEGRGVWVPYGLTARDIMVGAAAIEALGEAPYTARAYATAVLTALREDREAAAGGPS